MLEKYERPVDSIFWIEVDKIRPNPQQPRTEFNEDRLRDLADSIRQYGVLQPLVVTRKEYERTDGGLAVYYELIAGERRWRASTIAGLSQVPALIRNGEESDKLKLEMAIIENLQREDLNPVDRAQAFAKLTAEFGLKHIDVAKRIGKSREYVSNSLRILALPQEILDAIVSHRITEGHTKPILMLTDRPEEQMTLYREILAKRLTVREAEAIARRIAYDRVRKKENLIDPDIIELEEQLTEQYGTRVKVERKDNQAGKVVIDFFSDEDLHKILGMLAQKNAVSSGPIDPLAEEALVSEELPVSDERGGESGAGVVEEPNKDDDLYFIKNFSI